jgi:phosphatidate cytidylyltransferase
MRGANAVLAALPRKPVRDRVKQDDAAPAPAVQSNAQNLLMRFLAALVLIPIAVGVAYAGGWLWLGLVLLAAIGLYVEWLSVVGNVQSSAAIAAGVAALVAAGLSLTLGQTEAALAVLAAGAVLAALLSPARRGWSALGVVYASAALVASVLVRLDQVWGFAALMLILLIVWVTDIGGYVAGKGLGGPKLWPRVSPNKTWAGAIGGFVGSLVVATSFAAAGLGRLLPLLLLAAVLSVASQLGDLFESAVKRNFGVKDSSHIIPGHGGLLDRLDGYVFAVLVAALIGLWRAGADGVGRGLMVW